MALQGHIIGAKMQSVRTPFPRTSAPYRSTGMKVKAALMGVLSW